MIRPTDRKRFRLLPGSSGLIRAAGCCEEDLFLLSPLFFLFLKSRELPNDARMFFFSPPAFQRNIQAVFSVDDDT